MNAPVAADREDLEGVDFAFLGVPYGLPYGMRGVHSPASDAPEAVRLAAGELYANEGEHWDFDLDVQLVPDGCRLVDCGDVIGDPNDLGSAPAISTRTVKEIIAAGAIPLIVGGDDSIPPIVSRGLSAHEQLHVLHIDAHLDFRDDVRGVREGYSSPIRRLREQPWIGDIVQVGLRGVGSARRAEVEAARKAGNLLVSAAEVHERGAHSVFERLGRDAQWFVTIDCDGLDPSIAPGVGYPEPDGLTFREAAALVRGLAREGRIAAIELTEYRPVLDLRSLTALTIVRLLQSVISLTPRG